MDRFEMFLSAINQIYRSIQQIKSAEMHVLGLKGSHFICLYYLNQYEEGLTHSEIAQKCYLDKAAISRILNQLEACDCIEMLNHKDNRSYRKKIVLTEKGREICKTITKQINQVIEKVELSVSDEEREIFYRHLLEIADKLKIIVNQGGLI